MKISINLVLKLLSILLLLASASTAVAEDSMDSLKVRMKERYPQLSKLKQQQKVGETNQGFVEAIKPEFAKVDSINKIVSAENADRKQLYKIIAEETDTTPEIVGKNNALRIFQKAEDDEYFQSKDGKWLQKKDIKE